VVQHNVRVAKRCQQGRLLQCPRSALTAIVLPSMALLVLLLLAHAVLPAPSSRQVRWVVHCH
jgi:hypothetical protein